MSADVVVSFFDGTSWERGRARREEGVRGARGCICFDRLVGLLIGWS